MKAHKGWQTGAEQRVCLLYISLNIPFLSYNPEESTSFCHTTSFKAYSSWLYIPLMPCHTRSYSLRELSLQQWLNTNPSIVTPPCFPILKEIRARRGLHVNRSGLLWFRSFIHFTNQGSNWMRQVWWCVEEASHLWGVGKYPVIKPPPCMSLSVC